jgi:hypothetical protein
MTDFLSRLIDRSTGRAAVAHPVVAPLFATGPSLAADRSRDGEEDVAPALAASGPARRSSESPLVRSREEDPLASAAPAMRAAPVSAPFAPARFPPAVAGASGDLPPERSREDRLAAEPRPREGFLAAEGRIEGRATAGDGDADERAGLETPQAPSRLLRPPEPPRRVRTAATHPLTIEQSPAPIIRVSIGRIDVRAVSPAAPTAPSRPTSRDDRQSLEEYLKPSGRKR